MSRTGDRGPGRDCQIRHAPAQEGGTTLASLVPSVGKAILSGRMLGATPTQAEPRYMGWGTGAGAGAAGSTDLSTPATEARVAGTGSQVTTSVTNDTHQVLGTITATGAKTITNV